MRHLAVGLSPLILAVALCIPGSDAQEASSTSPKPAGSAQASGNVVSAATVRAKEPSALDHARDLYRRGRLDEARAEYEALTNSGGGDAGGAFVGLARVLLKQKRVGEADTASANALELAPSLLCAHAARGEVFFRQGKLAEAEREFLTGARANPPDARALLGLTRIYWATSNYKMAKTRLDQAHRLDPGDPEIRRDWLLTLKLEDRLKALKEYLASETNDEAEDREDLQHYLVILDDRLGKAKHGCSLVTKVTSTQTNLLTLREAATSIRGYALNVNINGTSSKLLLDTGAGGIVVNSKIAEKAGLEKVVEQGARGIGDKGSASGYIANAASIKIGGLEFQGCPIHVIDKKRALAEDGLIGADVFEDFLVDIDFPNTKFRLSELPPLPDEQVKQAGLAANEATAERLHDRYVAPEMKTWERAFRFGHDLLIWTYANNSAPKLFLLDTGAFDNMVSEATAREVSKVHGESDMIVKGISGKVDKIYRTNELTIRFANFQQKRPDFIAFDLTNISDHAGTEVGGILGFGMLWMLEIKIDYRDGLVNFIYDENRFH
jgi:predicted aspartyl protease